MTEPSALPPLPKPAGWNHYEDADLGQPYYSAAQMEAYAKRAIAALASPAPQPVAVKPLDLSTLLRDAFLAGRGFDTKKVFQIPDDVMQAWVEYDPEHLLAYQRIRSALASPAPTDEMVLVPYEPTPEMLDAYWEQTGESKEMRDRTHAYASRYYRAMIEAARSRTGEGKK